MLEVQNIQGVRPVGKPYKARLLGIRTPIAYGPKAECYGVEGATFLRGYLRPPERRLRIISDPQLPKQDARGRRLVYANEHGKDIGKMMVARGYATVIREQSFKLKTLYLQKEKQARAANKGLWGACG